MAWTVIDRGSGGSGYSAEGDFGDTFTPSVGSLLVVFLRASGFPVLSVTGANWDVTFEHYRTDAMDIYYETDIWVGIVGSNPTSGVGHMVATDSSVSAHVIEIIGADVTGAAVDAIIQSNYDEAYYPTLPWEPFTLNAFADPNNLAIKLSQGLNADIVFDTTDGMTLLYDGSPYTSIQYLDSEPSSITIDGTWTGGSVYLHGLEIQKAPPTGGGGTIGTSPFVRQFANGAIQAAFFSEIDSGHMMRIFSNNVVEVVKINEESGENVAFDAYTHDATTWTTSRTFSHTPVAAPQGVLGLVIVAATTEQTISVTYGGVTLEAVALSPNFGTLTASSQYGFFLGAGIPTGVQDLVFTSVGTANKRASVYTFTGDGDLQIVDTTVMNENSVQPRGTLSLNGKTCCCVQLNDNNATQTPLANWTVDTAFNNEYTWQRYDIIDSVDVEFGVDNGSASNFSALAVAVGTVSGGFGRLYANGMYSCSQFIEE